MKLTTQQLEDKYAGTLQKHEDLTDRINKLMKKIETLGLQEDISAEINIIDKERYDLHRELEKLGQELGKSEHEVRQEILAWRYSRTKEVRLPGLIILPWPKSEYPTLDYGTHPDNILKNRDERRDTPQIDYPDLSEEYRFPKQRGYLLVYNMKNRYGGEWIRATEDVYDKGHELKKQRVAQLLQRIKKDFPKSGVCTTEWTDFNEGVFHKFDDNTFEAIFIDEDLIDIAIEIMRAEPDKYWVTENEYNELCRKVVTETRERIGDRASIGELIDDLTLRGREAPPEFTEAYQQLKLNDALQLLPNKLIDFLKQEIQLVRRAEKEPNGRITEEEYILIGENKIGKEFLSELQNFVDSIHEYASERKSERYAELVDREYGKK